MINADVADAVEAEVVDLLRRFVVAVERIADALDVSNELDPLKVINDTFRRIPEIELPPEPEPAEEIPALQRRLLGLA